MSSMFLCRALNLILIYYRDKFWPALLNHVFLKSSECVCGMLHARLACHFHSVVSVPRVRLVVRLVVKAQQQRRPPSFTRRPVPPPPCPPSGHPNEQQPAYYYGEAGGQPGSPKPLHVEASASASSRVGTSNSATRDLSGYAQALVAAAFVIGLGIGTWFDSEVSHLANQQRNWEPTGLLLSLRRLMCRPFNLSLFCLSLAKGLSVRQNVISFVS